MNETDINYVAPPTVSKFMSSDAFIRTLIGPFGSGKSSGCVIEILKRAIRQRPGADGIRHTRGAIIRNSYRELKDTTQRTVEEWIPPSIRAWSESNSSMMIKFNDVECELLFRALDTPDDVKKLLSLEITFAWINEAKEIPKAVFEVLQGRVGRYPNSSRSGFCDWSGIWLDTNPPDTDHWIYLTFEEERPEEHEIYHQPSGLSPDAENIEHLLNGRRDAQGLPLYYTRLMRGKTKDWVDIFIHGRYGFTRDGKPVYPEYQDDVHTLKEIPPPPPRGSTLVLGMDFGLTPAIAVFYQTPHQQWQAIDEFVSDSIGATRFSAYVVAELKKTYPGSKFRGWGDPAGSQRSQVDERTPYEVVQSAGLPIVPAHSNDFVLRRESVAHLLQQLTMAGTPAFVVSPKCKMLRKAMAGAYCFRRLQVGGNTERFRDVPDKNNFSHIAEAAQYGMLGEGEDMRALDSTHTAEEMLRKFKSKTSIRRRR